MQAPRVEPPKEAVLLLDGHTVQPVLPVSLAYVPDKQSRHVCTATEPEAVENFPVGQAKQVVDEVAPSPV